MEAKLPWTSRVLPNPMTGDPLAVLRTVWVSSWLRRSLLCWLLQPLRYQVAEWTGDEQQHAERDDQDGREQGDELPARDLQHDEEDQSDQQRDPQPSIERVHDGQRSKQQNWDGTTICCQRRPCRSQPTRKNGSVMARLLPQELANAKGAFGLASGRPSTIWTSATSGWISDLMKPLLRIPAGSSTLERASAAPRSEPAHRARHRPR